MNVEISDKESLETLAMAIVGNESIQPITKLSKTSVITVMFYRSDRKERELMAYSDSVGLFRKLAQANKAWIEISDGRGGMKTKTKPKELV